MARARRSRKPRLLRCPFCDSGARVAPTLMRDGTDSWGVYCEDDLKARHPHGHLIDGFVTKEEAIIAWNTRYGE